MKGIFDDNFDFDFNCLFGLKIINRVRKTAQSSYYIKTFHLKSFISRIFSLPYLI